MSELPIWAALAKLLGHLQPGAATVKGCGRVGGGARLGGGERVYPCACANQELENREALDSLLRLPPSFSHENCESFLFVVVNSQLKKNP